MALVVPADVDVVELADLKTHLNITNAVHDNELRDMLAAAVETVEGYVGPLGSTSVTETHYGLGTTGPIILRQSPVVSVTSVVNADGTTYAADDYDLDGASGLLRLGYSGAYSLWSGQVTVTYVAGRATLPAPIKTAILIVADRLWETQRGNAPGARRPEPEDFGTDPGGLPLLPPRARELLAPYLSGPVVA